MGRGFSPDSGSTWLLPRLVGVARARRMLLLGEKVGATDAADSGLIHQRRAGQNSTPPAEALLTRLACGTNGGPRPRQTGPQLRPARDPAANPMTQELFNLELSCRTGDFKEGLEAFRQRRDA